MPVPRLVLILVLIPFSVLSTLALWWHGYWGIVAPAFESLAAAQVLADLVISLSLVMLWMWRDAQAGGRKAWPWIVATLAFGSFGPLLYLLTQPQSGLRH
jgi:hypothetical protein